MNNTLLALLLLLTSTLFAQGEGIELPETHYGYDAERKLVVAHLPAALSTGPVTGVTSGDFRVAFSEARVNLRTDTTYAGTTAGGDTVTVAFTNLPLVKIDFAGELLNRTKRPATFTYADGEREVTADIGARYRGSHSLRFPKKSLDLEFREGPDSDETVDVTFGDLREDDDWVLDALYNEPLRVNSYVGRKLWLDLHTPYYQEDEDEARAGADAMFVEVFFQGGYHGLYLLSEQVDRSQLKLKKFKDGELRGELYKANDRTAGTRFEEQPPLTIENDGTYAGWELKHPDEDESDGYQNLYDVLGFVANSSDVEFRAGAAERFELGSVADYFIFLNAASLTDNFAKNTYLARYEEDAPYFFVPWDLDVAFGNGFEGDRNEETDFLVTNNLFDRLLAASPAGYKEQLCGRYEALRKDLLSPDSIAARFATQVAYLKANGVYARETMRWDTSVNYSDEQIEFYGQHVSGHLAYLDRELCGLSTAVRDRPTEAGDMYVYPNPATRQLTVVHPFTGAQRYVIYGAAGRLVAEGTVTEGRGVVDVARLTPGVYVLRLADRVTRLVIGG